MEMKKLNLVCASIVLAFGSSVASAGTLTPTVVGGLLFASENFGGATSVAGDTVALGANAAVTYNLGTSNIVNPGTVLSFTYRLTGAKFATTPVFGQFAFAGTGCETWAGGTANTPKCRITKSADSSTILVEVKHPDTVQIGLGALVYTPIAAAMDNLSSTLATPSGVVSMSVGFTMANPPSYEATVAQSTVDSPLATGTIITSAAAIAAAAAVPTTSVKIDLTATIPASAYTTGSNGKVALHSVKWTNVTNSAAKQSGNNATTYTAVLNADNATNGGATYTVTPTVGSFPVGSTMVLNSAVDCAGGTDIVTSGSGTVAVTAATASTAKVLTTTVALASGTSTFVCLGAPSTGNKAVPLTTTVSAVAKPSDTKQLWATASGTGYALTYNGSTIDLGAYWGAAVSAAGYSSYVRVINTGSVVADVSMAYIDNTTGVAGTAAVVISNLAAGASIMLKASEIEAKLGAQPFGYSAGRLRITAPTNALRTQAFLQTATGAPQEVSAGQIN